MVSSGLGSDVLNDPEIIQNTWKLPDISSLHNVIRTGIRPKSRCKLYFSKDIVPPVQHQSNGGAERDRTADPLLAKQVLSQLSYSPNRLDHQRQAVGFGELKSALPTAKAARAKPVADRSAARP